MKIELIIILLTFSFFGCETKNKLEIEFENHLPKTDKLILEEIVNVFDNYIESEFNGNSKEYYKHIESKSAKFTESYKKTFCELLDKFDNSTLEYKSIKVKYDSVYFSKDGEIRRIRQKQDIEPGEKVYEDVIDVFPPGLTNNEQLEKIKLEGYWRFISDSSFKKALLEISTNNSNIQQYIDRKDAVGYINPYALASSIQILDIDDTDYFIKRIIAVELFINEIRINYGC